MSPRASAYSSGAVISEGLRAGAFETGFTPWLAQPQRTSRTSSLRAAISVPSPRRRVQLDAFRTDRPGRLAAEQRGLVQLAELVRLVLAQGVLRPDRPFGVDAGPRPGRGPLLEGGRRLLLQRPPLAHRPSRAGALP